MKTLTKDNLSLYLFDDDAAITMLADSVVTPQATICDCNSSNSTLHTNVTAPQGWAGTKFFFDGTNWTTNPLWVDPNAEKRKEQEALRKTAYTEESDPIFFMAQRGEATMEEWQAKVAEIKARYPYPAE